VIRCGVILLLVFLSTASHAQDADQEAWAAQMRQANDACIAAWLQKYGGQKSDRYADCIAQQSRAATETCIGVDRVEYFGCIRSRSLKAMLACDLSPC
jgi:hypothetical protein